MTMSLKIKIVGLFLLLALVPYIVIALFVYIDVQQADEKKALEKVTVLAEIQKSRTEEILAKYSLQLDQFLTRSQLRHELSTYRVTGSKDSLFAITTIIMAAKQGTPNIDDIFILDPEGTIVASTNESIIGHDSSNEEFFQKGSVAKNISTLVKLNGVVYAYLTGPLVSDGTPIGVIAIRVTTDDLFNLFKDYTGLGATGSWGLGKKQPNGDALIVVPGRYDTNPDSPLTSVLLNTPQNAEIPLMHAVSGDEETYPDLVNYRGLHVIAATRYIQESGWGIGVTVERSEILADSNRLGTQLILFSSLLILFVALLSVIVSQIILRPIRQLSFATERAAVGDLSKPLTIRSHDELGVLASTFNAMLAKLKASQDDLEARVLERTKEAHEKLSEVERLNKLMVGRELQMIELKKKIAEMYKPGNNHD